jgi:hypothetical protein
VVKLRHPSPRSDLPAGRPADIGVLLESTGRMALQRKYTGVAEPLLGHYARLSAVLFLSRRFEHRPIQMDLCHGLAEDPAAVQLVWAFLDLKQDLRSENQLGGQPFLTLDYLVKHWQDKVEKAKARESFGREIATLENALWRGDWLPRLPDLVERAQIGLLEEITKTKPTAGTPPTGAGRQALAEEAVRQLGLEKRPDLLATLLPDVSLESIGRNLETGRFIPYLITFHAKRGPLSQLIDLLTDPQRLASAGVRISDAREGRRMYNFRPYTENTRIGLVPSAFTFEQFQESFQKDLEAVLDSSDHLVAPADGRAVGLKGIEVMLHRFSPIGRYHYPFRSRFSSELALCHLKEVLAENLEPQELLTLVQSGLATDIRARILEMPIPEVIGEGVMLRPGEANALAVKDNPIKQELLGRFGAGSILELSRRLVKGPATFGEAVDALAGLIHRMVPRFDPHQSRQIAERYLDVVRTLSHSTPALPFPALSPPAPPLPTGSKLPALSA